MTIWKTGQMDPPWMEQGAGKIKRGADRHYPLLKTKDMPFVIRDSGLWTPDENAHLYLWVTNNFLRDGLWLMEELEFEYKTNVVWTKTRPGIGRYFRGKHELLLFGTRGRGWAVRTERNDIASEIETTEDWDLYFEGSVMRAEHETVNGKRKHSAKPKVFYDMIESRSQGPYAEFFARSLRPGWQTFGNDVALTAPSSVVVATQAALSRQREEAGLPPEPPPKKTRAKKPKDVLPIAEMDGADTMLNVSREFQPFAHISGYLDEKMMEGDGPTEPLDGGFATGPLPGGPTRHLPRPDPIPPPRPPSCPHGELRSACVLCRSRR